MSVPAAPQHQPYRDSAIGDVIIRTSDGVCPVIDASPVFADMFALGREAAAADGEKPDIALLPFCHLAEEPPITLDDISLLLEAGRKYRMVAVTWQFLYEKPFAVYTLACMTGVPRVAALAARRTLAGPLYLEYAKEYRYVSGLALYNLLDFRRRCGIAAADVVSITSSNQVPAWMQSSPVLLDMKTCGSVYFRDVRGSFVAYMERLHDALKLCPDSSLASSTKMLSPVITSALGCKSCASKIFDDTMRSAKVLESKIAEAIGKVELIVQA
ncbi:hypothetical protein L227DRAFT_588488 [Lentinus tigrinus ALCF2SS1-6]|uniref:BTB domain-containing protein n=1 Tax=Lentinus tigrinus ALCF2SS1-6 TaxID=1328759 RepID=A0A5C2RUM5_9APHY|nr:hypothetical protein L227DRAFT_588488 [Lentinus tigrinus ALCF2SS1-6]